MNPIISVIMSTYCRARIISRAIDSILNQTFKFFELIIIDDGSGDGTKEIIEEYAFKDDRIRWVRFDKNSGIPAIRYNQGMSLAKGDYIAFMFDDDEWFPDALENLYNFYQKNLSCGMIYGLADYIDVKKNNYIGKGFGAEWDYNRLVNQGNFLCNNTVLVKKEVINDVGGYDEDPIIRRLCDWDLWVRIGEKYYVKRMPIVVGKVNAFYDDSVGIKINLNFSSIKKHQADKNRPIPLKKYWSNKKQIVFFSQGHDAALQRWRIDYLKDSINDLKGRWVASKTDKYIEKDSNKLYNANIIVLYRFITNDSEIDSLKSDKIIFYDIDDYIFEEEGKYNNIFERRHCLHWMSKVNCITTTTKYLLNVNPEKNKCYIRKNAIPIEEFQKITYTKNIKNEEILRIGWLGGINRNENNDFICSFLERICRRHKIYFLFFGKDFSFFNGLKKIKNLDIDRRNYVLVTDPLKFYHTILEANLDCIINPLLKENFFNFKSELKFIETGILKIPLITSPYGIFNDIIKDKENGFLAETIEDFEKCIDWILSNQDKLEDIKNNAYKKILTEYNINHIRDEYILLLDENYKKNPIINSKQVRLLQGIITEEHSAIVGALFGAKIITQSFIGEYNNLNKIQLLIGTYARLNYSGSLEISIILDPAKPEVILRKLTTKCFEFKDNSWFDYSFEPIRNSRGVKYYIIIKPIKCTMDSSVTLYYSHNKIIPNGELSLNKFKFKGTLCFKLYYLNNEEIE